jgi:hypothetical protein
VVLEDLATRQQRYFRGHVGALACLAASHGGGVGAEGGALLAAAPAQPEPSSDFADIVVWQVAGAEDQAAAGGRFAGSVLWRLKYHPLAVQV